MHYWIWLSLAVTPGSESFKKLITRFETPLGVYNADETEIAACIGSRSRDFKALCKKELERASQIYEFCKSKSVGILTYADENFPKSLRDIDNPPALLYYRGTLPDFNNECFVSVVGTRKLTDYGRKNAFSIAHDLSRCGIKIVSGMAVGIDGVATAGALCAGGQTVAFLGCGIDICYPPVHLSLAKEIVKCGVIMTEYAPGTRPDGFNFPRRNRLISGISAATVVIEGNLRSGSIITAKCAKLQGRPVYALPGNVGVKTSEVTNLLIKDGAKLITDATDIVKDFEYAYLGRVNPFGMSAPAEISVDEAVKRYSVSCVTPSDDVFRPSRQRSSSPTEKKEKNSSSEERSIPSARNLDFDFDDVSLKIYKKIPEEGEILIESLADESINMRSVMRTLLKLEMGRFIVMLPGEKVKRNI